MKTIDSMEMNKNTQTTRGVFAWAAQMGVATLVVGLILFLAAGRLDWVGGWVFLGLNLLTQLIGGSILIRRQPDLLAERSKIRQGTKSWDRFFVPAIMVVGTFLLILTAGLDFRFGLSPAIPPRLWWAGLAVAFLSQIFVLWAMVTNRFFATTVRIQEDRGHQVIDTGPYRFVRHPGYAGSVLYTLAIALVLDSLWTLVPAVLTVLLLVARTRLEDQALQEELPGYREYAGRVRYRLLPGVW